jgi:hypothetical protein
LAEDEEDIKPANPINNEESIEPAKPVNSADKIFDETTIAYPLEEDKPKENEPIKDENGLLIETTTGGGPLNNVEAFGKKAANETENLDPKERQGEVQLTEAVQVKAEANSTSQESSEEGVPFPVNDLLNGIYKFVSSYIKPKPQPVVASRKEEIVAEVYRESDEDIENEAYERNSDNFPRDQLVVEAVDEEHSNSDPFFQVMLFHFDLKHFLILLITDKKYTITK